MGVLNVTPDSFSDGGLWLDRDAAVRHGLHMIERGAATIDVGGESTRPGAEPVPEEEELRRVLPVVETLASRSDVPISIDTRKPTVAARALEAGAHIVNDTAGEESDPSIGEIAASSGAAIVVMHSRGTPATMRQLDDYEDVVTDVMSFLTGRVKQLEALGVPSESIAIDPGIGFAKNPRQNLQILNRLNEFLSLGYPVLIGTSRKSFIGEVLGVPVDQRVEGSIASVLWAVIRGARMARVHDVEHTLRAVRMVEAILEPGGSWQTE